MDINKNNIIGELVAKDYRTATVFKSYGIDFCCQGNRTIDDACSKKGIDSEEVIGDLVAKMQESSNQQIDFQSFPPDLLADYIEKTHHRYVSKTIEEIKPFLEKVCSVHGENHPELLEIHQLFWASATELQQHMEKEERILFPFVRQAVKAGIEKKDGNTSAYDTVRESVQAMMKEHDTEGVRFRKIAELSNNYTPPADACNTYKVTFGLLKEFEDNLHLHIHLENNILFPKAAEL